MLKLLKPLLLVLIINGTIIAQNYQQNQILATQQGYQYTEAHFQTIVQFTEFLINQPLSFSELQSNRQEAIYNFNQNPAATIQDITDIYNSMQQLYAAQDPGQIALVRSAILCQLYVTINPTGENPYIWQLIQTYSGILAYDTDHMLVLTQKDVDGYLALMQFYAQLSGQEFYLDWNAQNEFQQSMVQAFLQGTLQDRQSLASMALMDDYVQGTYAQMNLSQQQNFTSSYNNSGNRDYVGEMESYYNASNANFQIMQNMMTESHVTTMNIIENMGDSGNYWKVTYDDY